MVERVKLPPKYRLREKKKNRKPKDGIDPESGRFLPGNNGMGGGRPKGSRAKLGEAFLSALKKDFDDHGEIAIKRCRRDDPVAYVKVIASILPKEIDVADVTDDPLRTLSNEQLYDQIEQLEAKFAKRIAARSASTVSSTKERGSKTHLN